MSENNITIEDIYKLIDKVSEKNLGELKIEAPGLKLEIKAKSTVTSAEYAVTDTAVTLPQPAECEAKGHVVKSPVVGTFYVSSAPDKQPFVKVNQQVKKGDVLYIVESMKLMNEITSDYDGVVTQIIAENAQPVEFGQPIMVIE